MFACIKDVSLEITVSILPLLNPWIDFQGILWHTLITNFICMFIYWYIDALCLLLFLGFVLHCTLSCTRNLWSLGCSNVLSAWDGTGCEFDSWQCRIYIPCLLSLRLLGSLRGSLGTYGLAQKLCLKKPAYDRQVIGYCATEINYNQLHDSFVVVPIESISLHLRTFTFT